MSHHQDSAKCAGKCAGLVSLKTSSNKKYTKVKDRRGQPIRGLWKRCGTYYARVTVEDPNGIRRDRRFAVEASNLSGAKEELARLRAELRSQTWVRRAYHCFRIFGRPTLRRCGIKKGTHHQVRTDVSQAVGKLAWGNCS